MLLCAQGLDPQMQWQRNRRYVIIIEGCGQYVRSSVCPVVPTQISVALIARKREAEQKARHQEEQIKRQVCFRNGM